MLKIKNIRTSKKEEKKRSRDGNKSLENLASGFILCVTISFEKKRNRFAILDQKEREREKDEID